MTREMLILAGAIPFAFLLGSIPFSLLVGLARGVDIRTVGSKNVGATNLGRTLGPRYFAIGFALDALKGLAPTLAAGLLAGVTGRYTIEPTLAWLWLASVFAAPLGHMFSPWVGFKGGKGVATGLGAMLGVFPILAVPGLGALVVFVTVLLLWRYVSAASCVAAISLPLFTYIAFQFAITQATRDAMPAEALMISPDAADQLRAQIAASHNWLPFVAVTALLAALVVYKHRGNLRRIGAGTEPKIGSPRQPHERPQNL